MQALPTPSLPLPRQVDGLCRVPCLDSDALGLGMDELTPGNGAHKAAFDQTYWLNDQTYWLNDQTYWLSDQTYWLNDQTYWLNDQTYWLNDQTYWLNDQTYWLNDQTYWLNDQTYWLNDFTESEMIPLSLSGPAPVNDAALSCPLWRLISSHCGSPSPKQRQHTNQNIQQCQLP